MFSVEKICEMNYFFLGFPVRQECKNEELKPEMISQKSDDYM